MGICLSMPMKLQGVSEPYLLETTIFNSVNGQILKFGSAFRGMHMATIGYRKYDSVSTISNINNRFVNPTNQFCWS